MLKKRVRLVAPSPMLEKVISGAQIGADIAGLRAAKKARIPTGGYIPLGFLTLNGMRPEYAELYGVEECVTGSYRTRTWKNVEAADATLRFAYRWDSPGEKCTASALTFYGKPALDIDPKRAEPTPAQVAGWIRARRVKVLNVAGNADECLEPFVETFLAAVFQELRK